jgi:ribosome-associated toxin RatA of RatAB toxin-antitoxin module
MWIKSLDLDQSACSSHRRLCYSLHRIDVSSTDPRFRKYSLSWIIEEAPTRGCQVSVTVDLELKSGLLQPVVNRLLPAAVDDIVAAFRARAHAIYAEPQGHCAVSRRGEDSNA